MSMNVLDLNSLMVETITCLNKTFTVADKVEREAAEARLKELEGDLLNHFKVIIEAIKEESLLSKELRVSVILYLRKIVKNRIADKSLSREYALEILKYIIDIVLTNILSDTCLQNLTLSLQDLLNFKLVSDNKQIVNDLVDILSSYLQNSVGGNIPVYKSITLLLENIMLSSSVSHQNVSEILQKTLTMSEFMLNSILASFKVLDINNNIDNLKVFLSYVEICKIIFHFLHTTVIKMRSRLNIINNVIEMFNSKFVGIASQLIMMTIPNILEPYYIAFKGDSEFDNSINVMKAKAFQFLNVLVAQNKTKIEDAALVRIYSGLIQTTIDNLDYVVSNKLNYIKEMSKDSVEFPDYNYENLIYQMILFLARIIVKSPFMDSFIEFSKNFAKIIIIPFLIGSNKEIVQMKEDGEEYSNYISDVIDDHKSKTIKSVTAFLLQNMCEKYDGFPSFITNYCFQLIDFGVKGADLNTLSQYGLLTASDRIFSLASLEFQIETSIMIFCILTSYVFKQTNLQEALKLLFDTHFNSFVNANSDIIKNRLCLFLGIYMDSIYEPEDVKFGYCLEYLFMNLFYYKTNQGVSHQAADSLNDIIGVKKFSKAIKEVIGKYLVQLIENIKDIKIGLYFDVMLEIVMNVNVDEYIVGLMKELTDRVMKEIAPYTRIKFKVTNENGSHTNTRREKDSQYNIIVNKCFNIIRSISDKKDYVTKYILILEDILDPIFEHMKNPTKIDFDEDIVLIMTSFIKHLNAIPKSGLKLLVELPKYLKKSKGLLLDLFELVNQYIVYGKGIIDAREDYSKVIMKIFKASFDKKSDYDKSAFLGATLMQIWLENSNEIPEQLVKEIILIAIDQIKGIAKNYKDKEEFEESTDLYTFVALLVVIYSGFINYPNTTFEAIIHNNDVNYFIQWSEELISLKFYSVFLTKSIIIGMCAFLRNENLMKQIPQYINKFLNFLLTLLNKQKNEESRSLKSALKKEIHCNFIDSDEEDEESEDEDEVNSKLQNINKILSKDMEKLYEKFEIEEYNGYSNEREIKDICERAVNPIKTIDEYEFYQLSVDNLKRLDESAWLNWTNTLNDKERSNLSNLLHTRRVNISHNKIQANVPRKIVKIMNRSNINQS